MERTINTSIVVIFLLTLSQIGLTLADWDQRLLPAAYRGTLGQGFATNYFKTANPLRKYNKADIKDVYDAGFRNLRLRCRADLDDLMPFSSDNFKAFLEDLSTVVDDCLHYNVTPIVSWIHHEYESNATITRAKENYLGWWKKVAKKLKDKDYRLSFNLFTELGTDACTDCSDSLRENIDTYNKWTKAVVSKIRATGGNNADRILILASPQKTAEGLHLIDDSIYKHDPYIMAEWHTYASGPNKKHLQNGKESPKYWEGNGSRADRERVHTAIEYATNYTAETGIQTYFGAWMPQDNIKGSLNQREVINFARYFTRALGKANIPWSLNVLDVYLDTKSSTWRKELQTIEGAQLNMTEVLGQIQDAMKPYIPVTTV